MNLLTAVLLNAFEKRGVSIKGVLKGVGTFAAAIPTWGAGQMAADKLTGGEKVKRENVYLPDPLFHRVMEQQRQAKLKEQATSGMKGI